MDPPASSAVVGGGLTTHQGFLHSPRPRSCFWAVLCIPMLSPPASFSFVARERRGWGGIETDASAGAPRWEGPSPQIVVPCSRPTAMMAVHCADTPITPCRIHAHDPALPRRLTASPWDGKRCRGKSFDQVLSMAFYTILRIVGISKPPAPEICLLLYCIVPLRNWLGEVSWCLKKSTRRKMKNSQKHWEKRWTLAQNNHKKIPRFSEIQKTDPCFCLIFEFEVSNSATYF